MSSSVLALVACFIPATGGFICRPDCDASSYFAFCLICLVENLRLSNELRMQENLGGAQLDADGKKEARKTELILTFIFCHRSPP